MSDVVDAVVVILTKQVTVLVVVIAVRYFHLELGPLDGSVKMHKRTRHREATIAKFFIVANDSAPRRAAESKSERGKQDGKLKCYSSVSSLFMVCYDVVFAHVSLCHCRSVVHLIKITVIYFLFQEVLVHINDDDVLAMFHCL